MSILRETAIPLMKEFLVYFAGFGCAGLLLGIMIVSIIPKPKHRKSRRELVGFILSASIACSLAIGMYFFAQKI